MPAQIVSSSRRTQTEIIFHGSFVKSTDSIFTAHYDTLSGNRDLDLNTRLQADAGLLQKISREYPIHSVTTNDLFDDLARGVQVDETFVDFELVTIPGFRSLTARLWRYIDKRLLSAPWPKVTHSLTSGDLQHLCGETDRSLDTQLFVLGAVDQIARDCIGINK